MVDLRTKMSGLTDVEKTQIANSIAGKNAMSGFLAIINASDKDFNKLAIPIAVILFFFWLIKLITGVSISLPRFKGSKMFKRNRE